MDKTPDKQKEQEQQAKELDLSTLLGFNFASNWHETSSMSRLGGNRDDYNEQRHSRMDRDRRPARERSRRPTPPPRSDEPANVHERIQQPREERNGQRNTRDRRDREPTVKDGNTGEHKQHPRHPRDQRPPEKTRRFDMRESPFDIHIVPEDEIMATLTKAMRKSLRTYELFELARLILEKPDRYHVSIQCKTGEGHSDKIFQSIPDHLPFFSEEAAIQHIMRHHIDQFFRIDEVDIEPPKGNFQFVTRCTMTGEVLGPTNYHRYQQILMNYHRDHFPTLPFDKFRSRLETVRDEAVIKEWLQRMSRQTRYYFKTPEGDGPEFDNLDDASAFLLRNARHKTIRSSKSINIPGRAIEKITDQNIRPFIDAHIEQQRRFPLDTATGLRLRLHRQHFCVYKKGSHGVTYACAIKRRFREANQTFAESVQKLLDFIDTHPMIHASELPEKYLALKIKVGCVETARQSCAPDDKVTGTPLSLESTSDRAGVQPCEPASRGENEATGESHAVDPRLRDMTINLRWLLSEGYVTEYSDGRLLAHQPQSDGGSRPVKEENRTGKAPRRKRAPETIEGAAVENNMAMNSADEIPAPDVNFTHASTEETEEQQELADSDISAENSDTSEMILPAESDDDLPEDAEEPRAEANLSEEETSRRL